MKNIKKILIGSFSILALLAFFSAQMGCSTTTTTIPTISTNSSGVITTNLVVTTNTNLIIAVESAVLTTGTQLGVQQFLKSNPKDTNYVVLIGQALNVAIANGNFNSTTFSVALNNAIGKNAPSEVVGLVNDLVALYNASEAVIVANKLNSNVFVGAALSAVANGLASQ